MDKTFNILITLCTKLGVDNHNPVKTSNINKPGTTPQIFCKVCDGRTKKLTHRPGKNPLRKHVNLKKGQKFSLFFFCFHL